MRKSRVYVDTSVIGGCCDPEFQEWSNGLLEDFEAGRYDLLLSSLTDAEIEEAPEEVKDVYHRFRGLAQEVLDLSNEAMALADEYLRHGIVPESFVGPAVGPNAGGPGQVRSQGSQKSVYLLVRP